MAWHKSRVLKRSCWLGLAVDVVAAGQHHRGYTYTGRTYAGRTCAGRTMQGATTQAMALKLQQRRLEW